MNYVKAWQGGGEMTLALLSESIAKLRGIGRNDNI
jgi:hypothetical protein